MISKSQRFYIKIFGRNFKRKLQRRCKMVFLRAEVMHSLKTIMKNMTIVRRHINI